MSKEDISIRILSDKVYIKIIEEIISYRLAYYGGRLEGVKGDILINKAKEEGISQGKTIWAYKANLKNEGRCMKAHISRESYRKIG